MMFKCFFSRWSVEGNPLRKKYKEASHMFKLAMAVVDLQKSLSPGNEQFKIAMCGLPLNIEFVAARGGEVLTRAYRWAKEKFSGRAFGLVDTDGSARLNGTGVQEEARVVDTLTESRIDKIVGAAGFPDVKVNRGST